jgi:hypothetical protein
VMFQYRFDIGDFVSKALLRRFEIVAGLHIEISSGTPPVKRANRSANSAVTAAVPFGMARGQDATP